MNFTSSSMELVIVPLLILCGFNPKMNEERIMKNFGSDLSERKQKHVVLLGASIGRAWNISYLPERVYNYDYIFEYVHGGSSFDKSERLREILARRENKPDIIIIKECAAYFPGDLVHYENLIESWIHQFKDEEVIPILATVVPVTRLYSFKKFFVDIIKVRNPLKYGNPFRNKRNQAILEFNDWLRIYCKENRLLILDLEASLRYGEKNRFLRENFARFDGLHLNSQAYKILDKLAISTINAMKKDY